MRMISFSKYHVGVNFIKSLRGRAFAQGVDQAPICLSYPGMVLNPMSHSDMRNSPSRTQILKQTALQNKAHLGG